MPAIDKEFCIVALGASAGGLEALEQFFKGMPDDSGVAFVIVQHLDPDQSSILVDLIKRQTNMQVFQITDGVSIMRNCVYVIPPNKDLDLLHGRLHLADASSPRGFRLPIDHFFRSLAEDQHEKAIGIVLSGTGTDGTLGVKAIKEAGGMTMAQEEATAKYDNMPRSAIATGCIDYILPPKKMPDELIRYVKHPYVSKAATIEEVAETHLVEMLKASKLESIGLLAGGIAHDFNNILTTIMGNIALSRITLSPDTDTYKGLAEAEKACLRAKGLTQQLLTFAKGGAPVTKTISIAELLRDTVRFALHGSNVRCEISFPSDLKPVEVDEGQISQVINNLIINAQQAMPEGGMITITGKNVRIETDQGLPLPAGDYIILSVDDQGTGIPKEHLAKIFDPFYTTKAKGSGLGLATSYWIIKKHNGYIMAESEPDAGTTFFIYLPASGQPLSAVPLEESAPLVGEGKILFLDDEPSIRQFIGKMLTRFGYEVECVQDGNEAIECYRKAKETHRAFDVVVLDLTIPGSLGGREVLQRLREIDPQVKAIVCSGYSNDPVLSDFKTHGFYERVAKPYQIEELSKKIMAVTHSKDGI
jgi:chemotaxis response regulator CheB/nitrogen-specific signal transduction histidine kinase